ncbi:hypothetical protein [Rhizobium sp. Root651]|uniref:hypothetical protein n=1 Tax=Rhizobium sp. Root651 TaxID=1736577 RepID=UPI000713875A|nr:hypothetical protein [Rhizobium sp. Root651]KRA63129.1 hypothetical protein ASD85_06675 [Rhizobium sp. Root651]
MLKQSIALSVALIAAGCSSTSADLEKKTAATAKVQTFSENYQEIYRRILTTAKNCQAGNVNAYASYDVEGQLYNELGYGEITLSMTNVGTKNYFWKAKVEKQDAGARLTVNAGNSLNAGQQSKNVLRWAAGDTGC